jgi:hypothetical protein
MLMALRPMRKCGLITLTAERPLGEDWALKTVGSSNRKAGAETRVLQDYDGCRQSQYDFERSSCMELLLEYDDKFELLDYCYYYHHYCNFLCVFLSIHAWGKYTLGMVFGYMMVLKDCPKG